MTLEDKLRLVIEEDKVLVITGPAKHYGQWYCEVDERPEKEIARYALGKSINDCIETLLKRK